MPQENVVKPELRELFDVLNDEVTWLHTVWELYIQFYGTNDENYEIMNESAPQFFAILKIMLFDELVMILNRLTEKASTFGKANASLEQLIEQIDLIDNEDLVNSLKRRLQRIRSEYTAFRTWRDKSLSHKDFLIALQKENSVLPGITRKQAQDAIQEVTDFINEFSVEKLGGQQLYKPFMFAHGDGNALLSFLKRARGVNDHEA